MTRVNEQPHISLPPGARVEFIVTGPPEGQDRPVCHPHRRYRTGWRKRSQSHAREDRNFSSGAGAALCSGDCSGTAATTSQAWLGSVAPVRVRHLYFSEKLTDPNDPASAIEFYLTVDGQEEKMFDMNSDIPNIIATQGDSRGLGD